MTFLLFLASILAVYCISLFVSKLSGPGHVFSKLRRNTRGSVKDGLSCPLCFGWWVSACLCAFLSFRGYIPPIETPLWTFALAGGSSLLHLLDPL